MKKKLLLLSAVALTAGLYAEHANAQNTVLDRMFGKDHLFAQWQQKFGTPNDYGTRPPLPMAATAHRKPTALQSRFVGMYTELYDGAAYVGAGDSMRLFWSGTRGAGTDYFTLVGGGSELYMEQYPASYEEFMLGTYMTFYRFDSMHYYVWNGTVGRFDTLMSRGINTLNSEGYISHQVNLELDGSTGTWNNRNRMVITYQGDSLMSGMLNQRWDGAAWENDYRDNYGYNSAGRLTDATEQYWSIGSNDWVNDERTVLGYDGSNISSVTYQDWRSGPSTWENDYRDVYTYSGGNRTLDVSQEWNGTSWDQIYRASYTFNAAGKITENLNQGWDGAVWEDESKYTLEYNPAGNITSWIRQEWDGAVWENDTRATYEYSSTSSGSTTKVVFQNWDMMSSSWKNTYRYNVEFNKYGQITSLASERWDAGGFWDVSTSDTRMHFLYEEFEDGVTNVNDVAYSVPLKVYPNPANDRVYIEGMSAGTIRMMDVSGREVWQSHAAQAGRIEIPTSQLAPGMYILHAVQNGVTQSMPVTILR